LLNRHYPAAGCSLAFSTPLELLVATILSAQCTDERVNKVTPTLFSRYPGAAAYAAAASADIEQEIRSTGFFRNKAANIVAAAARIVARHGGEVPRTIEELTALPGVGRKTANVVLGNAFEIPGIVVDTHVGRIAARLGLTKASDPVKIEFDLMPLIPRERWVRFSHQLIAHGRAICRAPRPLCAVCFLDAALCPSRAPQSGLPQRPEKVYPASAAVAPGPPPGAPGSRSRPGAMRKEGSRWK
ncbi:MAG: endonuclease III, partial [Legionella sp.]|nr:endonuclease III [Legionella sp.]